MTRLGWLGRARDVAGALSARRELRAHETWSRDQLLAHQRDRLGELVAHASRSSSFYRDALGGEVAAHEVDLDRLPILTRSAVMASFDAIVTRPDLKLAELDAHLAELAARGQFGDELYRGEYRVMTSGGSSGERGVFVYDREGWRTALAGLLRWSDQVGAGPRLPRRRRIAAIGAPDAKHMTYRLSASMDIGLHKTLRLAATQPISELVAALQGFAPEAINAYPSTLAALAEEQLAGRLQIRPTILSTSSELRTPEMTARIREAFGVEPYDCLGLTETGVTAVDCELHCGLHVFEDLCVYEVVDGKGNAVPSGAPGARVLVTNLFNRVLPLVRYEVGDLVRLDTSACACGRPFARIVALDGRSDDMLELPGHGSETVRVHPIHVRGVMTACSDVIEYQILQSGARIDAAVRLRDAAAVGVAENLRVRLIERLQAQGATPQVEVRIVDAIPREGNAAKRKLVRRVT